MAIEKKIVIDVDTVKAAGGLDEFKDSIKETNKEIDNTSASTQAMAGTVDKATGGAVSKFQALKGTLKTVIGSFKSLRIAIIGTGIGALLIAVTSLGQAFTRSEEGQNKFAKILGVIGSVTGNLLDLLADLGEGIISVFEDPKQALIDFKNLLVTNITNRFKAILDTVGFLGSAIKSVFKGDFDEALESAKKAGSSFVDSFTGVENSIDKATNAVKSFKDEIVADAAAAAKIADQRAKAEKMARDLVVKRAEAERDIAALREKAADKENVTAEERIKALQEAAEISNNLAQQETEVAKIRLEAKETENALTKSNKADLDEEAQLKAEVINKETQRLKLQKALTAEITTATREANKVTKDAAKSDVMTEEEKQAAIEKIQNDYRIKQENRDADNELKKVELEEQRKLAELKRLGATKEQLLEVEKYYDELKVEAKKKVDADILALEQKLAEETQRLEEQKTAAKFKALDDAISIAGAETGVGKALLIAKQALALKEMIMEAKKTLTFGKLAVAKSVVAGAEGTAQTAKVGFPQNIPLLISYAAQLAGIIGAVKSATSSANSVASTIGGGGAGGGGGAQPQAPSFNIVGATETSQLATAIGEQEQQPVQAYVVANDVTTAQSLNNNIVEGATL
jgi:hypothetical protein